MSNPMIPNAPTAPVTPDLDALRAEAEGADHAITGTMLAHMPVPEAKAVVALKAAIQNLLAALVAAPAEPATTWWCGCDHTNGANLAICAACGRPPGGFR